MRGGIVDILDVENFIGYEVESHISEREILQKSKRLWRLHDLVFIDLKKVPDSIEEAEKYLRGIIV